jgi:hypothetical protein
VTLEGQRNWILEESLNASQIGNGRFESPLLSFLVGKRKEIKRLVGLLHAGFYALWEMRDETRFFGDKIINGVREQIRLLRFHLLLDPLHTLLRLVDPLVESEKTIRQQFE